MSRSKLIQFDNFFYNRTSEVFQLIASGGDAINSFTKLQMSLGQVAPAFRKFKHFDSLGLTEYRQGNSTQMLLRISRPEEVKRIVEKFKKEMACFHLRSDGLHLIPTDYKTTIVHEIPHGLGDLEAVRNWFIRECPPLTADRMGAIAANEDTIAINTPHLLGDGKYYVGAINHINDPVQELKSPFPTPAEEVSHDELEKYDAQTIWIDPNLMRFKEESPRIPDELTLVRRWNVKEFKCYERDTGKFRHMTESTWSAIILSVVARYHTNEKFSLMTCVDLRPFLTHELKTKEDLSYCNFFAAIPVTTKANWKSVTLGECCKMFRDDLNAKVKSKYYYNFLKTTVTAVPASLPTGQPIMHSHVGVVELKDPITDAFFGNCMYYTPFSNALPVLTYSLIDKARNRNEIIGYLRCGCNGIAKEDGEIILKSIGHALKSYSVDMPMSKVMEDMRSYQKALRQ